VLARSNLCTLGGLAERPNALALKASVLHGTGGSNPSPSALGRTEDARPISRRPWIRTVVRRLATSNAPDVASGALRFGLQSPILATSPLGGGPAAADLSERSASRWEQAEKWQERIRASGLGVDVVVGICGVGAVVIGGCDAGQGL
jgi:hypothetical protein